MELLPHSFIESKEELKKVCEEGLKHPEKYNKNIYIIKLTTDRIMRKIEDPGASFEKLEYYDHPERFQCTLMEDFLPYLSLFVNGIYWDHRYPRLIKKSWLTHYYQ